ncbi:hypothetical protein B0H13DRAFT_1865094 [Mycena leptocephala]|nr:hypothetical protein B0H13DRAFT_1865094 [Mycena leptocephala]
MPKVNGALLPNKARQIVWREGRSLTPVKRSEDCERPSAELVRISKRKLKASIDIDGIIAALSKLNERLDFLEATIFGWSLPIEQAHHEQIPQNSEASNPWGEALARHRKVADQSLSGSTANFRPGRPIVATEKKFYPYVMREANDAAEYLFGPLKVSIGGKVLDRHQIKGTSPRRILLGGARSLRGVAVGAGMYHSFAVDEDGSV